jgi:ubiquitin-like modifier-activating enzyme 5
LTDQVQRINTKLQASLTTLSQASPSTGGTATADANGSSSGSNGNAAADAAAAAAAAAPRGKIDKMSAEVVDSNPYSRLMALQRMGIVQDYEKIRGKTVGADTVPIIRHV